MRALKIGVIMGAILLAVGLLMLVQRLGSSPSPPPAAPGGALTTLGIPAGGQVTAMQPTSWGLALLVTAPDHQEVVVVDRSSRTVQRIRVVPGAP